MGILYSNAELMIKAKQKGTCFDNVLTIGHLKLFISKSKLEKLIHEFNLNIDSNLINNIEYCDGFFKEILGTKNIQSLDYSDYENCDIMHDMNTRIDSKYFEKFDIVIDGGSLEHIFNFPVAISNCMNMIKKGGSFFSFTMANNHMGHGFYQFSPELFFRVFDDRNGFNVTNLLLEKHKYPGAELNQNTKIFQVKDPILVGERVGLVTSSPVLMMIQAKRIKIKDIFDENPIQSDYTLTYENHINLKNKTPPAKLKLILKKIFFKLPKKIQYFIEGQRQLRKFSFKNPKAYLKISK